VGYAVFLYYRIPPRDNGKWLIRALMIIRFLSVSTIAFLLTSPLIKKINESVEKPVIIIGIDNSSSLLMTKDSLFIKNNFPVKVNELISRFQQKFVTEVYSFGDRVSKGLNGKFDQKQTDISSFFSEVEDRFFKRNVGAVILVTDGIYNKGSDPFYAAKNIPFPIYTIALGDTDLKKDIYIKQVRYNKRVYKGDKFPVEITVAMDKCEGLSTLLSISKGNNILLTKEMKSTTERYSQKITFLIESKEIGVQKYVISAGAIEGEASTLNNRQECFVDVLDSKEKIAILFDLSHPDINTIRRALEISDRYEVEEINLKDISGFIPEKYDLIVLYQLPSIRSDYNVEPLINSGKPILIILGTQIDLNTFNRLKAGLIINSSKLMFSETLPVLNENFTLFTIVKTNKNIVGEYPPLTAPFGTFQYGPMTDILFFQKIGTTETTSPLVMFVQGQRGKIGVIAGENIWRWRVQNYFQHSNFESFDEIINKIVEFLTVKVDESLFKIKVSPVISENESVRLEAEVYNSTHELINGPEVNITIYDPDKKAFPFVFSKSENAYYLNAGYFLPGKYIYDATVKVGKLIHKKNGYFLITSVNLESINLIADHNLLFRLASSHDGKTVLPDKMDSIVNMVTSREDIHSVSYITQQLTDLIGNIWLFVFILFLLSTEWLIRKRNGL
jgi:hypothetical protein